MTDCQSILANQLRARHATSSHVFIQTKRNRFPVFRAQDTPGLAAASNHLERELELRIEPAKRTPIDVSSGDIGRDSVGRSNSKDERIYIRRISRRSGNRAQSICSIPSWCNALHGSRMIGSSRRNRPQIWSPDRRSYGRSDPACNSTAPLAFFPAHVQMNGRLDSSDAAHSGRQRAPARWLPLR